MIKNENFNKKFMKIDENWWIFEKNDEFLKKMIIFVKFLEKSLFDDKKTQISMKNWWNEKDTLKKNSTTSIPIHTIAQL